MDKYDRDLAFGGVIGVVLVVVLILGATVWEWYMAGLQSKAYARQGITLSQWECFVGVDPAVRAVNIKETP